MAANWRADKAPDIGLLISGNAGKSRLTPKILTLLMRKTTRTPDPAYRLRFKGGETFCSKKRRVSQDALETTDINRLVGPVRGGFFRDEGTDARTDQGDLAQERQTSGGLENDGVPGPLATHEMAKKREVKSKRTLAQVLRELVDNKLIVQSYSRSGDSVRQLTERIEM